MFRHDNSRTTTKRRASATNDPYRLEGVDARTGRARRYRDLVDAVIRDFPKASADDVREMAGLRLSQELLQNEIVAGTVAASSRCHGDLVRLSNLLVRKDEALRAAHKVKATAQQRGPTLDQILERHEADDDE